MTDETPSAPVPGTAPEQPSYPDPTPRVPGDGIAWALPVAVLWAVIAIIVGLVFIFGVKEEAYGGDAYTGIQAAIVSAVHAIGWLIISSGVLAVLIAARRYSR